MLGMFLQKLRKLVFAAGFGCCVPRGGAQSTNTAHQPRDPSLYTNPSPQQGDPHGARKNPAPTGVLITNLGTPAAPTTAAVRRYLAEFLSDPRVVELPRWLWLPVLHAVILRLRPRRSAAAYRKIWTEEGSPLLLNAARQVGALEGALAKRWQGSVKVTLGMRYGEPSIAAALKALRDWASGTPVVIQTGLVEDDRDAAGLGVRRLPRQALQQRAAQSVHRSGYGTPVARGPAAGPNPAHQG